jgi:hypothetical protein
MSSRTLHYRTSPFKVICPFTFIKHLLNYFVYGHPAIELFRNPLFMGILNKWETLVKISYGCVEVSLKYYSADVKKSHLMELSKVNYKYNVEQNIWEMQSQ